MSRVVFAFAAVTLTGCMNLRAATSGEIGCPESQIEIRDESTSIGSKTWTAECNGSVYYCSYHSTGEKTGQYSCAADASVAGSDENSENSEISDNSGGPAAQAGRQQSKASETSEPVRTSDPPTEAVGFTLAEGAQAAEEKCAGAGHTWSASGDAYVCSSTPVPVGADAKVRLSFCNDQLCDLTVFVTFKGEDDAAETQLNKILAAMRQKYGKPKKDEKNGTAYCRSQGMVRCVSSGGAVLSQTWEWTSGEKIYLMLKGKQGQSVLAVRYLTNNPNEGGASAF